MSVADVAEKANPAVVTILNLQPIGEADLSGFSGIEGFPDMPEIPGIDELPGIDEAPGADDDGAEQIEDSVDSDTLVPAGTGSGFIVDDIGHVITNAHVVAGAEELTVALADGTEVPATVVGSDELLDVAILKLDLPAGESVPGVATFGDSSSLRPAIRSSPSATRWGRSRTRSAKARSTRPIGRSRLKAASPPGSSTMPRSGTATPVAPCSTCAVRSSASIPPASAPA